MKRSFAFKILMAAAIGKILCAASAMAQPNLTPFQPSGWSDKIVVARTTNTTTESTNLLATDTLYVAWSVINAGNQSVTNSVFYVDLNVDSNLVQSFGITGGLPPEYYTYVDNYSIGSLSPGTHTLQIVADATMVVAGDNRSDDSYTKTISVAAVTLAAPTPYTPVNASTGQATVPYFTWSPVSNAASYRVLIATNAADLPGSPTATNGGASVVINAVAPTTNFSPTIQLNASQVYYWEVHAIGASEEDGTWTGAQDFTTGAIGNGITIIPTFDATITSDPQAATIEATIEAAIAVYRGDFSDSITANFTFYEMEDGLGDNDSYLTDVSYSSYRAALVSHATTADDATALAYLPSGSTNPVNGNSQMALKYSLARALGYSASPPAGQPDSMVYLNTSIMNLSSLETDPTKFSLFATVSHEMDEALGFGSALNRLTNGETAPTGPVQPEDLFRYDGSGNRSFTTAVGASSYFSLNATNDLAQFNQYQGGDFGDWYSYYGGNIPQVQDAFATAGANPVLNVELRGLDVIGFTRVIPASNLAAQLANPSVNGGSFQFNVLGAIGSNYVVQYSSNLATWLPLSTNSIPGSGYFSVTNAISNNTRRFYRAVLP